MKMLFGIGLLVLAGAIYLVMLVVVSQKDNSCAFQEPANSRSGWTNRVILFPPAMECRYDNGEVVRLGPFS